MKRSRRWQARDLEQLLAPHQAAPRTPRHDREHAEQVVVIEWAVLAQARYPELALLHATPNGGHRRPGVAGKLRAEGVRRGVPNLALPVPRDGAHGLYIEMKVPGGRESQDQKWWRDQGAR